MVSAIKQADVHSFRYPSENKFIVRVGVAWLLGEISILINQHNNQILRKEVTEVEFRDLIYAEFSAYLYSKELKLFKQVQSTIFAQSAVQTKNYKKAREALRHAIRVEKIPRNRRLIFYKLPAPLLTFTSGMKTSDIGRIRNNFRIVQDGFTRPLVFNAGDVREINYCEGARASSQKRTTFIPNYWYKTNAYHICEFCRQGEINGVPPLKAEDCYKFPHTPLYLDKLRGIYTELCIARRLDARRLPLYPSDSPRIMALTNNGSPETLALLNVDPRLLKHIDELTTTTTTTPQSSDRTLTHPKHIPNNPLLLKNQEVWKHTKKLGIRPKDELNLLKQGTEYIQKWLNEEKTSVVTPTISQQAPPTWNATIRNLLISTMVPIINYTSVDSLQVRSYLETMPNPSTPFDVVCVDCFYILSDMRAWLQRQTEVSSPAYSRRLGASSLSGATLHQTNISKYFGAQLTLIGGENSSFAQNYADEYALYPSDDPNATRDRYSRCLSESTIRT